LNLVYQPFAMLVGFLVAAGAVIVLLLILVASIGVPTARWRRHRGASRGHRVTAPAGESWYDTCVITHTSRVAHGVLWPCRHER
jgi:membrane protein YdbS with pleckstrin-like domain